jgi:hypothetical protein
MNYDSLQNWLFYTAKPLIPRLVQIGIRRQMARYKRWKYAYIWPIDPNSGEPPEGWPGWPDGKKFALVLSHDVDTRKGYDNVLRVAELEQQLGFRSNFNFVPERYGKVEISLLEEITSRGFGVGVHGLKHDGKLFSSRKIFEDQAVRINAYLKAWGTEGFTAPSMIRNHSWMQSLKIEYCISSFDTDPFEPQSEGVGSIFPFLVRTGSSDGGFIELPYSLPQDHLLFVILKQKTIDIWKRKLDWVAEKCGMALLNSHPDYMNFSGAKLLNEEYPVGYYIEFLKYVKSTYAGRYFHATPCEIAAYTRKSLWQR